MSKANYLLSAKARSLFYKFEKTSGNMIYGFWNQTK